jgi:CPA2 family monovalent cation:H+ antiporter-2
VAIMYVVGRRVIPRVLDAVAQERELFRLAVLAIALGVAFGAAKLFGVSFALGAFFAGIVLGESELSHRAAEESVPLREAFAVLFFVAVGMLFNPAIVLSEPLALLATLFIILVGKSVAAFLIVLLFRHPVGVGMTIAASLSQIGEFSFILAGLGVAMGILPEQGRDLVLAAAMITIVLNPFAFALSARLEPQLKTRVGARGRAASAPGPQLPARGHSILVGYGRVGRIVAAALAKPGAPFVVVESDAERIGELREHGIPFVEGNAASPEMLRQANPGTAARIVIAIPNAFEAGRIIKHARKANPGLVVVARAHSDAGIRHLRELGANTVIMGERQIALEMIAEMERLGPAATT